MRTIYFVGMHNKPGYSPLDSRTKTGKIIDSVISAIDENEMFELMEFEYIKTNLCNVDEFPGNSYQTMLHSREWFRNHEPEKGDIVITLGQWVYDNMKNYLEFDAKIIRAKHPASLFGTVKQDEYVKYIIDKIKNIYKL